MTLPSRPPPGSGGDEPGGPEPGWVDPRTWLSFQGPPGGSGIGPGLCPAPRCGASPVTPPYDLCGGDGLLCATGWSGAGAPRRPGDPSARGRREPRWRATPRGPPGPCAAPAGCTAKLDKEKLEPNPEESQDIKALQKDLEQFAKLLKQRGSLEYAGCGAHPGVLFGKVFSQMTIYVLRLCSSVSRTCVSCGPCCRRWRKLTLTRICRR